MKVMCLHAKSVRSTKAARSFYCKAVSYAIAWLPINDEVLLNARFVNFSDRTSATIEQVIYFVNRYN